MSGMEAAINHMKMMNDLADRRIARVSLAELRELHMELLSSDHKEVRDIGIRLTGVIDKLSKGLNV